jgi:hypothetical protein
MSTDLDRILLEIKDLRGDFAADRAELDRLGQDVDSLLEAVARTAYEAGIPAPKAGVDGAIASLACIGIEWVKAENPTAALSGIGEILRTETSALMAVRKIRALLAAYDAAEVRHA